MFSGGKKKYIQTKRKMYIVGTGISRKQFFKGVYLFSLLQNVF